MNNIKRLSLLPLLAAFALLPIFPLDAQTGLPPIYVGKKYVTEFSLHTITFEPLEFRSGDHGIWARVRIIKGRRIKKELGEVIWLNLSMLKAIAEANIEPQSKVAEQNGADQPATAPESKPEGEEKPKSKSEVRPQ